MREVKFRAKLRDGKIKYFSLKDIEGDECFAYVKSGKKNLLTCIECDDQEHIIMQYTGLKDKNGKEIYEGDLCNCWDTKKEKITFDLGTFWINGTPLHAIYREEEIEVIGNIYENPELL